MYDSSYHSNAVLAQNTDLQGLLIIKRLYIKVSGRWGVGAGRGAILGSLPLLPHLIFIESGFFSLNRLKKRKLKNFK